MLLALRFFSINDIVLGPLCVLILFFIIRSKAERQTDPTLRNIYYRGFYFKVLCVLAFTFVTEFVFKGGDTNLYYQGVKDLRSAVNADFNNIGTIISSTKLDMDNPLTPYFYYDNYADDFTFNYMLSSSNFFVPRLGLIPSFLFFNNYLCINFVFGFFALGGAIRLFKFFYYYYPNYKKVLAVAIVFLPSVGFWSAGLLKDPISFGCVGYILYAVLNIVIKKKKISSSLSWIVICGVLTYFIKVYILLVLILAILLWLFAESNKTIKDKTLRNIFTVMTITVSLGVGVLLLNYFTSLEAAQQYKLDTLMDKAEYQRHVLEDLQANGVELGSNFEMNTSNPVLLAANSLLATFFRPFLWEITSPAVFLSAIESLFFLFLFLNFLFKRGVKQFFKLSFEDPRMLMCFSFAIVFAFAVGASTNNFGALSRYKIPCMPFFFVLLLMVYKSANLPYPRFFQRFVNKIV
ncbi:MAG: hypothetical protein JST62_00705 [Bacteroidetes bacterium]|nr:hypothetical protein [Bacteroidota bacterium]